jgi:hypothetical protein
MSIKQYLDSTWLKSHSQAGLKESQNIVVKKIKKPLMKTSSSL